MIRFTLDTLPLASPCPGKHRIPERYAVRLYWHSEHDTRCTSHMIKETLLWRRLVAVGGAVLPRWAVVTLAVALVTPLPVDDVLAVALVAFFAIIRCRRAIAAWKGVTR